MTRRHLERLGEDGEYDDDSSATRLPTTSLQKKHACEVHPVVHSYTTDYGPQTLTGHLRSACDNPERPSSVDKGKVKEENSPNADLAHYVDLPALTHNILGRGVTDGLGDQVGSDVTGVLPGALQYGPAAAGANPNGGLESDYHTRQSSSNEAVTHSTTILSDVTNSYTTMDESDSISLNVSRTPLRRSERLARKESGSQVVWLRNNFPGAGLVPPQSNASITPSRSRSQLAIPFGAASSHQPSRFQSTNYTGSPERHISPASSSGSSRMTNFEEHTQTKRQAVRTIAATAPPSMEDMVGQVHKTARQSKQPGVSSFLVGDAPIGSGSVTLRPSQKNKALGKGINTCPGLPLSDECPAPESSIPVFGYAAYVPECITQMERTKLLVTEHRSASVSSQGSGSENENDVPSPEVPGPDTPRRRGRGRKSKIVCSCSPTSYPRISSATRPPCMQPCAVGSFGIDLSTRSATGAVLSPSNNLEDFGTDLWAGIARSLSTEDLKRLRLVSHTIARNLEPVLFRNVVVNFGNQFFDLADGSCDEEGSWSPTDSMFQKYGSNINQFGVAFEYDLHGLCNAQPKVIEQEQTAWFGTFTWPTEQYPRFPALQAVEDLVDHNRPMLKEALKHITRASELGLCIDSGHGWLEGPDISDLALFNRRLGKGSKVFGKTFTTEDAWTAFARNEWFRWAQQNTIHETMKHVLQHPIPETSASKEMQFLDSFEPRDIESFRAAQEQFDYDPTSHVGGLPSTVPHNVPAISRAFVPLWNAAIRNADRRRQTAGFSQEPPKRQPQWPLIFNGHNIAAEVGGHCSFVQAKTAHPATSPLLPGHLTEPQAQWLMETAWAQRAFLSSYTTAIITNKHNFESIHTVRISKLSSGLLSSLEQAEFWSSLPGLKHLQILISPDWRREHSIGDRFHSENMPISPAKAAQTFTRFLRTYVVKNENLHSLAIGYTGGGEHAVGIFARNQHVLPAPIIDDPRSWLHDNPDRKESDLTKFDHIRELKFENCWFTPWMLQEFMSKSRDTSLHSLVLESVSLTPYHDPTLQGPLTTSGDQLRCQYDAWAWHQEDLPVSAAWCQVLDHITPGVTLLERKHMAGGLLEDSPPPPKRSFRGHIQKITLNSCGYAKISVPPSIGLLYKQNAAVVHFESPMDHGLQTRKERFSAQLNPTSSDSQTSSAGNRSRRSRTSTNSNDPVNRVMMNTHGPGHGEYPWLGTLTQCVHPIEKRVLEEGWGMTFGWGDNLDRWAAVEDGCFEGGTGRFSGIITKDVFGTDDES